MIETTITRPAVCSSGSASATARAASRQKLAEDANAPQEFSFQPPASQAELNKALQEFREGRARDAKTEDQNRGQNLARKQELLGQLRQLGSQPLPLWSLQAQRCMAAQPAPAEDLIEVTVDGKPVKVPKGSNVLQACDAAGVDIPR